MASDGPHRFAQHRFAQHTAIRARAGRRDELIAKFLDAAEMQRENPACELMIVSSDLADGDLVYLTEIWATEPDWEAATQSPQIQAWAASMPDLVAGQPDTIRLEPRGGKDVRPISGSSGYEGSPTI